MNFAITRHSPRRRIKKKNKSKDSDVPLLVGFAKISPKGAELNILPTDADFAQVKKLRGYVHVGRSKLFITVHPDRINVLHCDKKPYIA